MMNYPLIFRIINVEELLRLFWHGVEDLVGD